MDMKFSIFILLILNIVSVKLVSAGQGLYFDQNFDNGVIVVGVGSPQWWLKSNVNDAIGSGEFINVVSAVSHSGKYSLAINYDARNGICNMCGSVSRTAKSGYDGVPYFVDNMGQDLTLDPIYASPGKYVYNKTNGFSKWKILTVGNQESTNDKLSLSLVSAGIMGNSSSFSSGDDVMIFRACGVDGTIGNDINRRSDCNAMISYFDGLTQQPGESIYRREYIMIPSSTTLPYNQKIRYWDTADGSIYLSMREDPVTHAGYLFVGANSVGGPGYTQPSINLERDAWYYIEEEFKAESSPGAGDGEYRLWLAKSGNESVVPVVNLSGITLGTVAAVSLWGNEQHDADSHGYIYIDDVRISSTKNGPVIGVVRPNPPKISN